MQHGVKLSTNPKTTSEETANAAESSLTLKSRVPCWRHCSLCANLKILTTSHVFSQIEVKMSENRDKMLPRSSSLILAHPSPILAYPRPFSGHFYGRFCRFFVIFGDLGTVAPLLARVRKFSPCSAFLRSLLAILTSQGRSSVCAQALTLVLWWLSGEALSCAPKKRAPQCISRRKRILHLACPGKPVQRSDKL